MGKKRYFRPINRPKAGMEEIEDPGKRTRTRRIYPTTVISTSMVLLMIGLVTLIGLHARNLSDYIRENIVVTVIMNQDAAEKDVLAFQHEINGNAYVRKTVYISKDSAASSVNKDFGGDFRPFLGYNPLSASINIYLKPNYAVKDSIGPIKARLLQNSVVKEVNYQQSLVESVNHNINTVQLILLVFAAILLIIAISLIYLTVRLAIYSRRFLIKSMQLVGATRGFIRRPFLSIGLLNGFFAGLLAIAMLYGLLNLAEKEIPELIMLQDKNQFIAVYAGVLVLGVMLSLISTFFAVNKHLRTNIDKLYH